jgi:hypothetical protein
LVDIYSFTHEPFEVSFIAAGTNHSVLISSKNSESLLEILQNLNQ